jgi:hypothetical protein
LLFAILLYTILFYSNIASVGLIKSWNAETVFDIFISIDIPVTKLLKDLMKNKENEAYCAIVNRGDGLETR